MLTNRLTAAAALLEEANRKLVVELCTTGRATPATQANLGRAMLAVVAADLAGGLVATPPRRPELEPGLDAALLAALAAGLAAGAAATAHEGLDMLTGNQEHARKRLSRRQIGGHVRRLSAALRGERG